MCILGDDRGLNSDQTTNDHVLQRPGMEEACDKAKTPPGCSKYGKRPSVSGVVLKR